MKPSAKNAIRIISAAVLAAGLSFAAFGSANALPDPYAPTPVDPANYLVGDTAYFSLINGANCAIHANGDVGCDFPAPVPLAGILPVTDVSIDVPFLPAHPLFGLGGPHGRPGSPVLGIPNGSKYPSPASISYAGATCSAPGRGAFTCTSKGHSFAYGSQLTIS